MHPPMQEEGQAISTLEPKLDVTLNPLFAAAGRQVLILGAGRRVHSDVVPVLESCPEHFDKPLIVARTSSSLLGRSQRYDVYPISLLRDFGRVDYIYIAVPSSALRLVMTQLSTLNSDAELIIDTPVDLDRHTRRMMNRFSRIHVAEDIVLLPWIETLHSYWQTMNLSGEVILNFDHSAYLYHGVALAKAICRFDGKSGAIIRHKRDGNRLTMQIDGGATTIIEPRDYENGVIRISKGGITVSSHPEKDTKTLEFVRNGNLCCGFRIDSTTSELSITESELIGPVNMNDTVVSRMLDIKRVGLLRMMMQIKQGQNPWRLDEGIDDFRVSMPAPGRFGPLSRFIESLRRFK